MGVFKSALGFASRRLSEGGILSGVPAMYDPLSRFFVQATIILAICRGLALVGTYMRQPKVIFEIIGGILLGPSAIGRDKSYLENIFPQHTLGYLQIVANIGLTFYLFLVGLELDPKLLMTHAKKAGGIAVIGMAVPFALGVAISPLMFNTLQGNDPAYEDVSISSFFVFVGTAMSITAFPVLARILKEGGLIYTKAGAMTMGAAALNDALAWCLLTLAISIANAGDMATAGYVFLSVAAFAIGLLTIIRPVFEKLVEYVERQRDPAMQNNLFALTVMVLFMCAWTTACLGVHAIFGAFLFGLCVPRGSHLFKECIERIEEFVVTFMLPLYFALSGLKTDVTTIQTSQEGAITVLVCVVASFGKFIGAGGTAYLAGMTPRESSVVAVLMNTRGLIELIVLNLGMDSGILSIRTFSVMVIMCLFTTFLTCPLVDLVFPKHMRQRSLEESAAEMTENEKEMDEKAALAASAEELLLMEQEVELREEKANTVSLSARERESKFSLSAAHLGLVVERLTHISPLLRLLVFFLPHAVDSALGVTAVHPVAPTRSRKDEFLPLNEDGKLIRVDEETTDFATALVDFRDPAATKPELLPLSMFCKSMDVAINAFRIQGDPDEFPLATKRIFAANECTCCVVPWWMSGSEREEESEGERDRERDGGERESEREFAEKLFWATVASAAAPVALFVSLSPSLSESAAHNREPHTTHALNGHREPSVRRRGNSVYHSAPSHNNDESESDHHTHTHTHTHTHFAETEPTASQPAHTTHTQLYSTVPTNILAPHRRGTVTHTLTKMAAQKKRVSVVVALLTGRRKDVTVLSLLTRFAENPLNSVYLLVPKDLESNSSLSAQALSVFSALIARKKGEEEQNVEIVRVESVTSDLDALYEDVVSCVEHFDLFVSAFVEPALSVPPLTTPTQASHARTHSASDAQAAASAWKSLPHRTASLSEALGAMMLPHTDEEERETHTHAHIHAPARLQRCGLRFPELGVLGNKLYEDTRVRCPAMALILHESERLRTNSLFPGDVFVRANSVASAQAAQSARVVKDEEVGVEMVTET